MSGNVIPPEFGVPLDASELNSSIPISVPYLVTPSNQFIPAQATSDGKLVVSATFSGSITIGEIGVDDQSTFVYGTSLEQPIGGVYQDTNPTLSQGETGAVRLTEYRAFHINLRDSSGNEIDPATETTSVSILTALDQFQFNNGALVVTDLSSSIVPINRYAENSAIPGSTLTTILTYTVPNGQTFNINGIYGWGTYNGEFNIQIGAAIVGGGWSSASIPTLHLDYSSAPIIATAGQIVTINVIHYASSTQDFKANLLGTLQ